MTIEELKELHARLDKLQKQNALWRAQLEYIFWTFHGGTVITFTDAVVNEMARELGYPSPVEDWDGYRAAFNEHCRKDRMAAIVGD